MRPISSDQLPQVDVTKCSTCGDCLRLCPTQCFQLAGGMPRLTIPQACIRCAICVDYCPEKAFFWSTPAWVMR